MLLFYFRYFSIRREYFVKYSNANCMYVYECVCN